MQTYSLLWLGASTHSAVSYEKHLFQLATIVDLLFWGGVYRCFYAPIETTLSFLQRPFSRTALLKSLPKCQPPTLFLSLLKAPSKNKYVYKVFYCSGHALKIRQDPRTCQLSCTWSAGRSKTSICPTFPGPPDDTGRSKATRRGFREEGKGPDCCSW